MQRHTAFSEHLRHEVINQEGVARALFDWLKSMQQPSQMRDAVLQTLGAIERLSAQRRADWTQQQNLLVDFFRDSLAARFASRKASSVLWFNSRRAMEAAIEEAFGDYERLYELMERSDRTRYQDAISTLAAVVGVVAAASEPPEFVQEVERKIIDGTGIGQR